MKETLAYCVKCERMVYRQCDQYWCGQGFKTKEDYCNSLPKTKEK